jgi:hypothetical protein
MANLGQKCVQRAKQTVFLLLVALALMSCNRQNATPVPSAPATSLATVAPTEPNVTPPSGAPATPTFEGNTATPGSSESTPGAAIGGAEGAIFTSPRFSYTIVLPCCWLALPTPGTAIESVLAELEAENGVPVWGDLSERLRERESGALLELIAMLPDDENLTLPVAQVTVGVLPAHGMTLDNYLAATEAELTTIANTDVLAAYIEPTLSIDTYPASVIEYTAMRTPDLDDEPDEIVAGLQVAFFGLDAEWLIILTFTTTQDRFDALRPDFLHIVRGVSFVDAAE